MPKGNTKIYASASAIGVSANNKNFPKLARIPEIRILCDDGWRQQRRAKRMAIVGRCPSHEVA